MGKRLRGVNKTGKGKFPWGNPPLKQERDLSNLDFWTLPTTQLKKNYSSWLKSEKKF
jgi:hypothetical protein